mmetsp:Transcript_10922/g.30157  ORF Transcript_10922/g.30157 Transcript_10922/m.30157 type:complete len:160 (+) Transcript_10922:119-598(+)
MQPSGILWSTPMSGAGAGVLSFCREYAQATHFDVSNIHLHSLHVVFVLKYLLLPAVLLWCGSLPTLHRTRTLTTSNGTSYQRQPVHASELPSTDARQPQQEEELINMKQREWVRRGRNAAVVAMTLWCGWIVVVQLFLKDILPNALYVRSEDYAERTGW